MFDWHDIRAFLAVARAGSTLTASKALSVSQPTVARRIAALEEALGVRLFERRPAGYKLTSDGQGLMPEAEAMERAAEHVAAKAKSLERAAAGVVRLTTNDFIATRVMAPALRDFRELYPDIQIELVATDRFLDIGAGEADIAIRAGPRPTQNDLVVRRIVQTGWRLFCTRAYAEKHGVPRDYADLNNHLIVSGEGVMATMPAMMWLERTAPNARVVSRCNTLSNLVAAVRGGVGVSVLPNEVGGDAPDIIACCPPPEELKSDIWLITHERLRNEPRVRAFLDFVAAYVASLQARVRASAEA